MHAVIFEVKIKEGARQRYLDIAGQLREELVKIPGFISVERFQSLTDDEKLLSLSYWESEDSLLNWKRHSEHLEAQTEGRRSIFKDYRICVVKIERDYTLASSSFDDERVI